MRKETMIWKSGCFLLGMLLVAGLIRAGSSGPTKGRIARFDDAQGTLVDSVIREDDSGRVAIGARPNAALGLLVNGGRLGVKASTTGSLGALVVSQNDSGPIATFRKDETDVRMTIDDNGIDVQGAIRIAGEEVIDATGALVAAADRGVAYNPNRVALGRWYDVNRAGFSVDVGTSPEAAAFDGANIWAASSSDATLTKIAAHDGEVLGTYPTDGRVFGLAYDGAHLWIPNFDQGTVTKMRAQDGSVVGTYAVDANPPTVEFDGEHIWVASLGTGSVHKIRASNGSILGTYAVGPSPVDIEHDGSHIWVLDSSEDNLRKLNGEDGSVLATYALAGESPTDAEFDGTNLWVASRTHETVTKLRPSDGAALATIDVGNAVTALVFDGSCIWASSSSGVSRIRARDAVLLETVPLGGAPHAPIFDGASVWVLQFTGGSITKL